MEGGERRERVEVGEGGIVQPCMYFKILQNDKS